MKDAKKTYLLVKDSLNRFSIVEKEQSYYLDYLQVDPAELTQQDFWLIIGEYLDNTSLANITELNGKLGGFSLGDNGNALTASEIIQMVGRVKQISSITLELKHVEDNSLTIYQNGTLVIDYNFSKGVSPYLEEIAKGISSIIDYDSNSKTGTDNW
ncbi:hypothetical protein AAA435_11640 [Lactobacillus crispatus]|uniref:hypothetical protein n=1 Tax=Lactobacillus crispatus TaxID=47770 RepID=UPI0030F7F52B